MASRRALAAASRGSVITPTLLREEGFSDGLGRRQVRAGRWQRGAYGIYLPHARPPTDAELVAVAREHAGPDLVVSGLVVLRALQLPWLPADPRVLVLVPPDSDIRSSGLVKVQRATGFDRSDTWNLHGVPAAMPERAVIDAARAMPTLRSARGLVLGAVAAGVAPGDLRVVLDAGRRNGSALTRRSIVDAERGCASPPEAELVDGLIGCGRRFYVNPQLWLGDQLLGSPDVWLVGLGLGGEVESVERHGSERDVESTYVRHERITAPGLGLVHLSVRRIRTDAREAAEHLLRRAAVRERSAADLREPAGLRVVPRGPLLR